MVAAKGQIEELKQEEKINPEKEKKKKMNSSMQLLGFKQRTKLEIAKGKIFFFLSVFSLIISSNNQKKWNISAEKFIFFEENVFLR